VQPPGARHTERDRFGMQYQTIEPARESISVAQGYGLKIYVHRGHLIVEDGIFDERSIRRYNRATSRLRRLFVIGHTGFITLEAMRWIRDVGATFAQIDSDGTIVALSASARHHESKLRRAQALAAESDVGRRATVALLRAKLIAQARVVERLAHLKPTVRVKDARPIAVAEAIIGWAAELHDGLTYARMREIESAAGRNYWQTWARVAPRFDRGFAKNVPDHWLLAGPRTSWVDGKRARKAATPVHAILNFSYTILEVEATIAAHKLGFDPSLGLMHSDQRYRGSLATDLMEPVRPVVDGLVLNLLESHELCRGDVFENREGVCRIGPALARRLALFGPTLRSALAPLAEQLSHTLLQTSTSPTPLTRRNHRKALAAHT
jgi:CRISPR-associated endonuclease Cas1